MRFGLFGGAKTVKGAASGGYSGDSMPLRDFIDYIVLADELGYSNLFLVEHHFTGAGQVSSSLNLLSYLAGRTRSIRLGTAVIVLPWHNPALLAEEIATLDLVSAGRFDFGIGKGYRPEEFQGFCIPIAEASERFDETLEFLRKAWMSEGRFSHQGKHWRFENVVIEPRPAQLPHPPLWMGGTSPQSICRAAREGVNLLLDQVGSIALTTERVTTYRAERERLGLPWQRDQIALTRGMRIVANEKQRQEALSEYAVLLDRLGALKWATSGGEEGRRTYIQSDAPLIGTPEQIIAQLHALQAGGIETVLLADVTGSADALRIFGREVMPEFADHRAADREQRTG